MVATVNIDRVLDKSVADVRMDATMMASAFLFGLTYADRFDLVDEKFIDHYVAYRVQVFELDERPIDVMEAFRAYRALMVTTPLAPPCLNDATS